MNEVTEFFSKLFDTTDWPPRWQYGNWSQFHGWLHLLSDIFIGAAFLAIPCLIINYLAHKKNIKFPKLYFLFAAFLLACGTTHIVNAIVFWIPVHRLSALLRLITAIFSWVTVFYLIKYSNVIFSLKTHTAFEAEIEERKKIEVALKKSKKDFELLINGVKDYSIFMLNKHGKVASWNSGATNIEGYTADEIIGMPLEIFYTNEEKELGEPEKNLQLAVEHGRFETEGWRVTKDKNIFRANIVITPLYDDNNKLYGYANVTRDITEKRKAAEQINFLASIADNIKDPIITSDNEFKITQWNNAAENLLGWKTEEVIGKNASKVLGASYSNQIQNEILAVFLNKKSWSGEVIIETKDSLELNVLITLSFIIDAEGKKVGTLALIKDITARKIAEHNLKKLNDELEQRIIERAEKLSASEKRFRMLIENSADGIDLSDEFSNNFYRSPGAIKITGILPQKNQMGLFHPADVAKLRNIQKIVLEKPGVPTAFQARFRHQLGHYVWLEGTITNLLHVEGINAFITNFRDVTQRKELEMLLHKANTLARIGGWEVDLVKAKVFWSDITREIHETAITYEPDLATGINFYKEGTNRDLINKIVKDAIEFGTNWDIELQIITAKNNERWVRSIGETEFINGKCTRIYGSFQDIDQRKTAEEKIKNINIELEDKVSQRTKQLIKTNEEMEAFSYSISHDLRAPLRGIIGFTNILEEDYSSKLDEEAMRITGIIKNNTIKMGNLIDDLLSFARLGSLPINKTAVHFNQIIDEVITEANLKPLTNQIKWIIHPLPVVFADVNTMIQVWTNLISNAIKYSNKHKYPVIEIGYFNNNTETVFFIKDNGIGFDLKYKHKLFKVFQRLHSALEFEGTGVGLAIVEKIISKHGGSVWAEGTVDQGACFYFSLPHKLKIIN